MMVAKTVCAAGAVVVIPFSNHGGQSLLCSLSALQTQRESNAITVKESDREQTEGRRKKSDEERDERMEEAERLEVS